MTVQSYRQVKPHDPESCRACGERAPGHQGCQHDGCDEIAEAQHRRHATDEEYAAIPEDLLPADQVAHMAVFTCGDHEPDPICGPEHHQGMPPGPQDLLALQCPKCDAVAGVMCTKANESPRSAVHKERIPAPTPWLPDRCDHVHRADCGGLGACQCSADDSVPSRAPREVLA